LQAIPDQVVGGTLPPNPEFNGFKNEMQNAILNGGIGSLLVSDVEQLSKAIVNLVSSADFYVETGAVNAYVANVATGAFKQPTAYFIGMRVRFRASNTNTGASTINVSTLGVKNIFRADGVTTLSAGDISVLFDTHLIYDIGIGAFKLHSFGTLEINNIIANSISAPVSGTYTEIFNTTLIAPVASVVIPITNGATYKFFKLRIHGNISTTGSVLAIRFNSDATVSYTTTAIFVDGTTGTPTINTGTFSTIQIFNNVTSPNSKYDIVLDIGFTTTDEIMLNGAASLYNTGAGDVDTVTLGARFKPTPAFTSIDLLSASGILYDTGTEISLFARVP